MSKVIICGNQKGGVAKTTTVVNLGIGLARKGKKVLVIDNDPQGSLTEALGYQEPDRLEITLAQVMDWVLNEEKFDLNAGILHHAEGVDLMPANIELSGVETSLVGIMSSETVLKEYIEMIDDRYDYIIVDCSPNLTEEMQKKLKENYDRYLDEKMDGRIDFSIYKDKDNNTKEAKQRYVQRAETVQNLLQSGYTKTQIRCLHELIMADYSAKRIKEMFPTNVALEEIKNFAKIL